MAETGEQEGRATRRVAAPDATPSSGLNSRSRGLQVIVALLGGVTTVAAYFFFHALVVNEIMSDFAEHTLLTSAAIETGAFPGHALFYLLQASVAGFANDPVRLTQALVGILAVATGAKAVVSALYAGHEFRLATRGESPPWWLLVWAALCGLAFSLPIDSTELYLGQIPPNVWHNSTTVLLVPFAVGLFWASLSYLRTADPRRLWVVLLLIAVNVLAKPSFVLCFIVVFPLAALVRFGRSRRTLWAWVVTAVAGIFVALQALYIYLGMGPAVAQGNDSSSIRIDLFNVWSHYSDNILLSFFASYLFPIVALMVGGTAIRKSLPVRYALGLAAAGLFLFITLTETGPREFHGNFFWQAVVTNYVLFLAIVAAAVPWLRESGPRPRAVVFAAAFAIHVVAAIYYLYHWLDAGSYY